MSKNEILMQRCLELASLGKGSVSPNPLVGSAVVYNENIIGEGWHRQYGGPHAEVNAIASVQDKSLLRSSTLYVSLEPCAHWGKTPPCADFIIENKIPRVVIGCRDSNGEVDGKGIARLREAGVDVAVGILEAECRELNARFFTWHVKKRPYIILKWARSKDGFIAREDYSSRWISAEHSRALAHQWRAEEDAVMVGANTAVFDNPQLTCRAAPGRNPVRLVVDRQGRLPKTHHLFDGCAPTFIFTDKPFPPAENVEAVTGIHFLHELFVQDVLDWMYARRMQSVIIEGGAHLLTTFINAGAWDEARVFTGDVWFRKGIAAPPIHGAPQEYLLGSDTLSVYRPAG